MNRKVGYLNPSPEANIHLGEKLRLPGGIEINELVTVEVTGKVTALRADRFGKSMTMTVQRIKNDAGRDSLQDDLKALRQRRRM